MAPSTSIDAATNCIDGIKKILAAKEDTILNSSVLLTEINKSGVLITIEYFTQGLVLDKFNQLKEEVNIALKKMMEENELMMAAATSSVTIINEPKQE